MVSCLKFSIRLSLFSIKFEKDVKLNASEIQIYIIRNETVYNYSSGERTLNTRYGFIQLCHHKAVNTDVVILPDGHQLSAHLSTFIQEIWK